MARNMACDSFDAQHATRSAQPGFRNIVGVRQDLAAGPDLTGHGMQCGACHNAQMVAATTTENNRRTATLAALTKLKNFGGASGATPLTNAEVRLIFNGADLNDF
jgi:hypothetical protein